MWENTWIRLLDEETESVVAACLDVSELREILLSAASRRSQTHSGITDGYSHSLLPLRVCYAIKGECETALPVAAAYHLLQAAADIFDDIEDADSVYSLSARYGAAIAINAATTLVILAEKAIARLSAKGVSDRVIIQIMDVLNSYYATACAGQHLDLSTTLKTIISEDEYCKIAGMKSASQSRCACHIGALAAGADQKLVEGFSEFGYHIGMASQVSNDIQGIIDGSDIRNPKLSLPLVYALNHADAELHETLEAAFNRKGCSEAELPRIRESLFACGAVHYTVIRAEHHKQQAEEILNGLGGCGIQVDILRPAI